GTDPSPARGGRLWPAVAKTRRTRLTGVTMPLADVVKAYDVRGLVPDELDADVVHALGAAFAEVIALEEDAPAVVIGHDMRAGSPPLVAAFARGLTAGGVAVTGLARIRDLAGTRLDPEAPVADTRAPGTVSERGVLADYARFLRGLVDLRGSRPLRVTVDAGNGMGGLTVPAVLGTAAGLPALPVTIDPM